MRFQGRINRSQGGVDFVEKSEGELGLCPLIGSCDEFFGMKQGWNADDATRSTDVDAECWTKIVVWASCFLDYYIFSINNVVGDIMDSVCKCFVIQILCWDDWKYSGWEENFGLEWRLIIGNVCGVVLICGVSVAFWLSEMFQGFDIVVS